MSSRPPVYLLRDPGHFLSFGFGSGYAPKAPGTFGTLAAIPVWWMAAQFSTLFYLGIVALVILLGVWLCGRTATALNTHDHPAIVWDEIAGFLVTMLFVPAGWLWVLLGFGLFRLFDILKPWPISWLDNSCKGGFGIMVDDVVAGVFACLGLHGLVWLSQYVA